MKLYSALYQSHDPWYYFDDVVPIITPDELGDDGCLLLHGGEDIHPGIYGQAPNSHVHVSKTLSQRDRREIALVQRAEQLGIPIIGICRGAQLLCALAGGTLVQDVTGHEWGKHDLITEEGEYQMTNSIHHQMMNVKGTNHKVIAWCDPKLSKHYLGEKDKELDIDIEPEIVYFPELNALAVQGHPEYLTSDNPFVQYTLRKAKQYVFV